MVLAMDFVDSAKGLLVNDPGDVLVSTLEVGIGVTPVVAGMPSD